MSLDRATQMQALGEQFRGAGHGHFLAAINRSQSASWRQSQWKLASSIDLIWATRVVSASSSASFRLAIAYHRAAGVTPSAL